MTAAPGTRPADPAAAFVDTHFEDLLTGPHGLLDWLRIPSISAMPEHAAAVTRSADWLAAALRAAGFPRVETWPTGDAADPGLPSVFAAWDSADPGAPTVLLYGHHDVQPVDPLSAWTADPFDPQVVGEELIGRGSADDKGQVLMHLLGLRAHLAATGRSTPAVHLRVLVEGEEEVGSPHFRALLEQRRAELGCDVVVVSDTSVYARDTPSLCTGMRGLVSCQLDVTGAPIDLHSGSFGGAVPNPATVLARLLAGLHDDHGRVTLPGFYDDVATLTDTERELFARLPYDEDRWLATVQARAVAGEAGYSTLERIWARPTAEVHGLHAGYTGAGQKTIVPTRASAKVSFRLVAHQDPAAVLAAFRGYAAAAAPAGLTVTVTAFGDGVRPCLTPLDSPWLAAAARAMTAGFGTEPLFTREGGSGPEADLAEVLAVPVLFVGVGLPDDRIHAPNERVVLPMLRHGAVTAAHLWAELAGVPRR